MATDFDLPPLYDQATKLHVDYFSDGWVSYFSTFIDTLLTYLSQYGIFIPEVTTEQRDTIQNPNRGQMIYNTTLDAPQIFQAGVWKTFTTT